MTACKLSVTVWPNESLCNRARFKNALQHFYPFFWGLQILGSCERGMKVYHHKLTLNSFLYDFLTQNFLTQNNKDVDFFFFIYCKQTDQGDRKQCKGQ